MHQFIPSIHASIHSPSHPTPVLHLQLLVLLAEPQSLCPLHVQCLAHRITTETLVIQLTGHRRHLMGHNRSHHGLYMCVRVHARVCVSMCVCVYVRACVLCARLCVCVCVCARVCVPWSPECLLSV